MNLQGFIPAIVDAIEAQSGKPCGNNREPGAAGTHPGPPYSIASLFPSSQMLSDYTTNPFGMQWVTVQVNSFAKSSPQCNWMADRVREALIGTDASGDWLQPLEPDDLTVCGRLPLLGVGIDSEDGEHEAVERFQFLVTG